MKKMRQQFKNFEKWPNYGVCKKPNIRSEKAELTEAILIYKSHNFDLIVKRRMPPR
jgi:hypothetical protein